MCLAVPGKIIEQQDNEATVDLQGNRLKVSTLLTPDVSTGDWVLIHAGFAIAQLDEDEARETWDYLKQVLEDPMAEAGGDAADAPAPREAAQ